MKKSKIKHEWSQEEKKILSDLFPIYSSRKWKIIAFKLKELGFSRTELECRQKWINFLDPNVNNENWRPQELQKMYNMHDSHGNRWCYMQKQLNRTQNSIKNRFYGTIRNYIRMILNTICEKHTVNNAKISKIPPSLLNDIYNSQNGIINDILVFDFMRGEMKKMIYRMKFQIDKKILRSRIKEKYTIYRQLLSFISNHVKNLISLKYVTLQDQKLTKQNNEEEIIKKETGQFLKNGLAQRQQDSLLDEELNSQQKFLKRCKLDKNQSSQHHSIEEKEEYNQHILDDIEGQEQINLNKEKRRPQPKMQNTSKNQENQKYQNFQNKQFEPRIKQEYVEQNAILSENYYPFMMQNSNLQFFNSYDLMMERMMFNNMAQRRAQFMSMFINQAEK